MAEMSENIKTIFEALKLLDMKPTPHNVSIMNSVYDLLRAMYSEANKAKEGVAGEGQTADTEG